MRRLVLVSLIVAGICGSGGVALAEDHPFASFFENTIVVTAPPESRRVIHINSDGTWLQKWANGDFHQGIWIVKGQQACFQRQDIRPYCTTAITAEVGDEWEIIAPTDITQTESLRLEAGRSALSP